ncbi:MAG: hypothetical protein RIR09_1702 [Pseudomonadota bacterium]
MPTKATAALHGVAVFDARPFFEKVLQYGIQNQIIDAAKLESINTDAPKGMVQIARYFGTEFLRPDLERARERIVNLVSLNLEVSSQGDLRIAAQMLRENSFMSRSKAASDMLKALIAMPQNSHFGMNERGGFTDEHIPLLAKWSLRPLPDYQIELARRSQVAQFVDAAIWMADQLGLDVSELEDAGKDAEAVIRTALLANHCKRTEMPDWAAFETMIQGLRKKYAAPAPAKTAPAKVPTFTLALPKGLPPAFKACVQSVQQSVLDDLPRILDTSIAVRKLFDQTPAFLGRYFWQEDALTEVDHFDRAASAVWTKATAGHTNDSSLLTLFLCIAVGSAAKTVLTEKSAGTLVRKIRKSGLDASLAHTFIAAHAPPECQADYATLWDDFMEESLPTLRSDMDYALNDALSLLRRECNIGP